jgi:hypothetical protein
MPNDTGLDTPISLRMSSHNTHRHWPIGADYRHQRTQRILDAALRILFVARTSENLGTRKAQNSRRCYSRKYTTKIVPITSAPAITTFTSADAGAARTSAALPTPRTSKKEPNKQLRTDCQNHKRTCHKNAGVGARQVHFNVHRSSWDFNSFARTLKIQKRANTHSRRQEQCADYNAKIGKSTSAPSIGTLESEPTTLTSTDARATGTSRAAAHRGFFRRRAPTTISGDRGMSSSPPLRRLAPTATSGDRGMSPSAMATKSKDEMLFQIKPTCL